MHFVDSSNIRCSQNKPYDSVNYYLDKNSSGSAIIWMSMRKVSDFDNAMNCLVNSEKCFHNFGKNRQRVRNIFAYQKMFCIPTFYMTVRYYRLFIVRRLEIRFLRFIKMWNGNVPIFMIRLIEKQQWIKGFCIVRFVTMHVASCIQRNRQKTNAKNCKQIYPTNA